VSKEGKHGREGLVAVLLSQRSTLEASVRRKRERG